MKNKNERDFSMALRLREECSCNIFKENKVRMSTNITKEKQFTVLLSKRIYISNSKASQAEIHGNIGMKLSYM